MIWQRAVSKAESPCWLLLIDDVGDPTGIEAPQSANVSQNSDDLPRLNRCVWPAEFYPTQTEMFPISQCGLGCGERRSARSQLDPSVVYHVAGRWLSSSCPNSLIGKIQPGLRFEESTNGCQRRFAEQEHGR